MVLVEGIVDGGNLTLAEEIVERGVELGDVYPQVGGRIAIDDQGGLQAAVLRVGADIHNLGNRAQGLADAWLPRAQLRDVVAHSSVY